MPKTETFTLEQSFNASFCKRLELSIYYRQMAGYTLLIHLRKRDPSRRCWRRCVYSTPVLSTSDISHPGQVRRNGTHVQVQQSVNSCELRKEGGGEFKERYRIRRGTAFYHGGPLLFFIYSFIYSFFAGNAINAQEALIFFFNGIREDIIFYSSNSEYFFFLGVQVVCKSRSRI